MSYRIVGFLLTIVALSSCKNEDYFDESIWKYSEGHHFTDFIYPGDSRLSGDTLTWRDTAVAIIEEYETRIIGDDRLHIRSLESGKTSLYISKGTK